ncbi:MAG: GGDEF domain-containing protein [Myxococcaceae bacterium]|nr:GGDEF domain-containing protein [Myxococcaceae bacterium]
MKTEATMEQAARTRDWARAKLEAAFEQLKRENERLAALAYRDALTGLRNRRYLSERLAEEFARLRRGGTASLSVVCIDVNDFKRLNDTLGHAAGDAALVEVGRLLESLTRASDLVCRVGGDEFLVMLSDTDEAQAQAVVGRIQAALPVLASVGLGARGLSVGVATYQDGDDEARLVSRADLQMFADKRARRSSGLARGASWASAA